MARAISDLDKRSLTVAYPKREFYVIIIGKRWNVGHGFRFIYVSAIKGRKLLLGKTRSTTTQWIINRAPGCVCVPPIPDISGAIENTRGRKCDRFSSGTDCCRRKYETKAVKRVLVFSGENSGVREIDEEFCRRVLTFHNRVDQRIANELRAWREMSEGIGRSGIKAGPRIA